MKQDIILSIITPTYNRSDSLNNCYVSLQNQTDRRFEWIIIDDGSVDDTQAVVESFLEQSPLFPIYYIHKENGGKHTALNASHHYVHGKYVLVLDSDDTLTEDAVAIALNSWAEWENHPEVGIVTLLKGQDKDHPNCYARDENKPVDIMAYKRICPVSNDACEVIRSELFLRYPFPIFPGERFLSEGALWNRVSFTHKCVYVNRVVYLCKYLEDGLTKAGRSLRVRNPCGGMYTANLNMAAKNGLKKRIKNGLLYTCYGFFAQNGIRQQIKKSDHPFWVVICSPFGFLLHAIWKHKYLKS